MMSEKHRIMYDEWRKKFNLKIVSEELIDLGLDFVLFCKKFEFDMDIYSPKYKIGIDPGTVNLGMAFLTPYESTIQDFAYLIKLSRDNDPVTRLLNVAELLDTIFSDNGFLIENNFNDIVIEGTSFGAKYRQVELAEQRAILAYEPKRWNEAHRKVEIIPPVKIRENVLGNGRLTGGTLFSGKTLFPDKTKKQQKEWENCADAIICALYN